MFRTLLSLAAMAPQSSYDTFYKTSHDLGHYRGQAKPQLGYADQVKKASEGARKFREFKKMRGKG